MNKDIMRVLFPMEMDLIASSKCPFCKSSVTNLDFRDEISYKEYGISGLCQKCQDKMFDKNESQSNEDHFWDIWTDIEETK